jgi:hypothetical protein
MKLLNPIMSILLCEPNVKVMGVMKVQIAGVVKVGLKLGRWY